MAWLVQSTSATRHRGRLTHRRLRRSSFEPSIDAEWFYRELQEVCLSGLVPTRRCGAYITPKRSYVSLIAEPERRSLRTWSSVRFLSSAS